MTQKQGISLSQAAQGGLIDDIDVTIEDAAFCPWSYNGAIDHDILALGIQYKDVNGKTYDQYYSAGELTYFVPSDDDGSMAIPVADRQMLSDSCNAWKLIASLLEAGLSTDITDTGNVKKWVGMNVHVKQFDQPKRQGLIRGGKNPDREPTVLLVTAINSLPGEQPAAAPAKKGIAGAGKPIGKPAQATPAAPKTGLGAKAAPAAPAQAAKPGPKLAGKVNGQAGPSTTAEPSADDELIATDLLNAILIENEGTVTKKALPKLAFQAVGEQVTAGAIDASAKTRLVQLLYLDKFLHKLAEGGGIVYDGATISLAA